MTYETSCRTGTPNGRGALAAGMLGGFGLGLVLVAVAFLAPRVAIGAPSDTETADPNLATTLPVLPEAVASFGACVDGDWLYVYGGHVGRAHAHSRENLAWGFRRVNLEHPGAWQELEYDLPLQGLALVSHRGAIYRVGGMSARNDPDEEEDLHSTASVHRFDPRRGSWEPLTPLPEPRSSHDAVVLGDRLYVAGGWELGASPDGSGRWHADAWVADLSAGTLRWERLPQPPFTRRALALAALGDKVYVIGGLDQNGDPSPQVDIFDTKAGVWRQGPPLPASGRLKGFGASAFGVGDAVYASARDGVVYRLPIGAAEWETTDFTLRTPRFFHRLVPHRGDLLFLGGASRSGHLNDIERIRLRQSAHPRPATTEREPVSETGRVWPGFRGDGSSRSPARDLPVSWNEEEVAWSIDLPGYGQSSPVVQDDRVFVTCVRGEHKEELLVACFDLADGDVLWIRGFDATHEIESTEYVSRAAPTPVVDGERLFAFFESGDLFALDLRGNLHWHRAIAKEYGKFEGRHGVGSSLAQSDGALFLVIDHEAASYLLCLDKKTGENRWKAEREARVAWTSPLVLPSRGRVRVIISSSGTVEAYDGETGERIWQVTGLEGNTVPSPSHSGDTLIAGASEKGENVAIRTGGRGDVTNTHVVWRSGAAPASFASPLVYRDCVYTVNRAGVARCSDLRTGEVLWAHRLPSACWASPIATGEHVYFFGKEGDTTVIRAGDPEPEVVARSQLGFDAPVHGVAAVDGAFVLRAGSKLACVRTMPASSVEEAIDQPTADRGSAASGSF